MSSDRQSGQSMEIQHQDHMMHESRSVISVACEHEGSRLREAVYRSSWSESSRLTL